MNALVELGKAGEEMLNGALEISVGALFEMVGILMELLGDFRKMTAKEISEAKKVFSNSLPYNEIHIHIGSWLADISSFFKKNPNAITTMRVVHFPSGVVLEEGTFGGETKDNFDWLMHELTHVWQGEHVGPMYMAHALYAQATDRRCL